MGSGVSFDMPSAGTLQYFCHSCRRMFPLLSNSITAEQNCPFCNSSFLEDITDRYATSSHQHSHSHHERDRDEITEVQSRRLQNAALMLRILEAQLQEELHNFHLALTTPHLLACVLALSTWLPL